MARLTGSRIKGGAAPRRKATPADRAIGDRVKQRRLSLGMSQAELGERIGVTFQQVQKYELGTNRMGAGRLAAVANALGVPITFFFDETTSTAGAPGEEDVIVLALRDPETVALIEAFAAVADPTMKRRILDFVRALTGDADEEPGTKPQVTTTRTRKRAGGKAVPKRR